MRSLGLACGIALLLGCAGLEEFLPEDLLSGSPLGEEPPDGEEDPDEGTPDGGEVASEADKEKVREALRAAQIKVSDLHESCSLLTEELPEGEVVTKWLAKLRRDAETAVFDCSWAGGDARVLACKATFSSDSGDDEWMREISFETDADLNPIAETIRCSAAG